MDEESFGIIGVLLIVTVLVMSQTTSHKSYAASALASAVSWTNAASLFGCAETADQSCPTSVSE
jgi:hypothetical protein